MLSEKVLYNSVIRWVFLFQNNLKRNPILYDLDIGVVFEENTHLIRSRFLGLFGRGNILIE